MSALLLMGALVGWWAGPLPVRAAEGPTPAQVAQAIALRRARVHEFEVIREAAGELGLRVWLFGGTAAGFAHYVRRDLAREGGDGRYQGTFFDYDFTNIYRSTQDADLVVDGTPAQAAALERVIREKMGFLQGSKEHWEVRLLRQDRVARGGQVKQALLANPDFLDQHTDSNSTGMIELTEPPPGESVVRDLRDWDSPRPFFLRDVTEGRLHYYWSATHGETSRFRAGDNPPLFSVIRYLVKAFQYGLAVDGEDLEKVRAVVDDFEPARDYPSLSGWAQGWLERYGPNLIRHSLDVEQAWNTLERLGLREKLIALSKPSKEGTLGWWLSREPLRTGRLGQGPGRTAAELGITVVAHETRDFLAYESITRDTTLRPNVLISRKGFPGELAALGSGFYTRRGRTGARGTGLTIRFRVDPEAREGADFTVARDFVIFHNRAALTVIPESLDVSLTDYFGMLRDGVVNSTDRGAWMKLQRRLFLRSRGSGEEGEELAAMVSSVIEETARPGRTERVHPVEVLRAWLALPASQAHPEVLETLRRAISRGLDRPDILESSPALDDFLRLTMYWLSLPDALAHPEVVREVLEAGPLDGYLASTVFRRQEWSEHPALAERLVETGTVAVAAFMAITMEYPGWASHPEVMRALIEKAAGLPAGDTQKWVTNHIITALSMPEWGGRHPELAQQFVERMPVPWAVALLERPRWSGRPELLLALVARLGAPGQKAEGYDRVQLLLGQGSWRDDPVLRRACGGEIPRLPRLQEALRERAGQTIAEVVAGLVRLQEPGLPAECP